MDTVRVVYKIDNRHLGLDVATETSTTLATASLVFCKSDPLFKITYSYCHEGKY